MKKQCTIMLMICSLLGITSSLYSTEKKKLFTKKVLAFTGIATTAFLKQQFDEKSLDERKINFLEQINKNHKVQHKIQALNKTIYNAVEKNIYFYSYLNPKHKALAYNPLPNDKKRLQNQELNQALIEYAKTVSTKTVDYYKNKIDQILSIGALLTSIPLAGYIIGRCLPAIVNNPKTIIPTIISRALIIGIVGEMATSVTAAYVDQEPQIIIDKAVKIYEKYEKVIHKELEACITNEIQFVREQLEYNNSTVISSLIKPLPFEDTLFILSDREGTEKAFADFNKKYIRNKDRSFFMRYVTPFFISSDLKMAPKIKEK